MLFFFTRKGTSTVAYPYERYELFWKYLENSLVLEFCEPGGTAE